MAPQGTRQLAEKTISLAKSIRGRTQSVSDSPPIYFLALPFSARIPDMFLVALAYVRTLPDEIVVI